MHSVTMNVKTVINGINNNERDKRNNKAQRNNECTVSRTVVDWKMFTFRLGSHVSLLFSFLVRVAREPSYFHLEFCLKTELFELRDV